MSDNDKYILIGMLRRYSFESTNPQKYEDAITDIVAGMDEEDL